MTRGGFGVGWAVILILILILLPWLHLVCSERPASVGTRKKNLKMMWLGVVNETGDVGWSLAIVRRTTV